MEIRLAKLNGQKFITATDSLKLDELQKDDSTILLAAQQELSDIKANARSHFAGK